MNVTIFGGANPIPSDPAYAEAELLGRLLAQAGHSVLTGGYIGTMEAASKGAAEAGGHRRGGRGARGGGDAGGADPPPLAADPHRVAGGLGLCA